MKRIALVGSLALSFAGLSMPAAAQDDGPTTSDCRATSMSETAYTACLNRSAVGDELQGSENSNEAPPDSMQDDRYSGAGDDRRGAYSDEGGPPQSDEAQGDSSDTYGDGPDMSDEDAPGPDDDNARSGNGPPPDSDEDSPEQ